MQEFTLNSTSTPLVIGISQFDETTSIVCTPTSATYTLEYSCSHHKSTSPRWVSDSELTAVNVQKTVEFGKITMIRVTLVSGTSVTVDVV
jgi:hypothetical protein